MLTLMFTIIGMHCSSCAMSIDGELEDTEGIKAVSYTHLTLPTTPYV